MRSGGVIRTLACCAVAGTLLALAAAAQAAPEATIRWTAHGIPHIEARDFEGLGYG